MGRGSGAHRAIVAALAAGLLAAGCGGDDTSDTAEWADSLCSAVTTFTDDVRGTVESLADGDLSRDSLESAVDDVEEATDTFTDDIEELERPETDAGEEAQTAVDELADSVDQAMDEIRNEFEDASSLSESLEAAAAATRALAGMGEQVSSTWDELRQLDAAGELGEAFEQAESCDTLRGES